MKHLLFLTILAMILTTTAHSQEKEPVYEPMEPLIEVVTEDPPSQVKREVMTAVDPMVEIIPDDLPDVVEKAPVYPGCSGENNEELKRCTRGKILEHIGSNFNYHVASETNLTGRQQIIATFVIDSTGKAGEIKTKQTHPVLKNEVIRVLESLPQMEAGEQDGEKVNVPFIIPIVFDLGD